MQDVVVLCRCFQAAGFRVHLETNGTYPIPSGVFDYVTVSPKIQSDVHHVHAPFLEENEAVADEFKYVISRAEDLQLVRWGRQVFLQPNCEIPAARRLCVNAVMDHPGWRLSLQIHKHLGLP